MRTLLPALLVLLAATPSLAQHSPQCAGVHRAEEGAERSQGPWSVTCFQDGKQVWREGNLYAFCKLTDGVWRFQGWWQHESGQALIVPESPAAFCVWRQDPPEQPKRP